MHNAGYTNPVVRARLRHTTLITMTDEAVAPRRGANQTLHSLAIYDDFTAETLVSEVLLTVALRHDA